MNLSIQDCLDMSDLTEDEVLAIAQHEHIPEILAVELGSCLMHEPGGERCIERMIEDDIHEASAAGDMRRTAQLKDVLKHFVEHHPHT